MSNVIIPSTGNFDSAQHNTQNSAPKKRSLR